MTAMAGLLSATALGACTPPPTAGPATTTTQPAVASISCVGGSGNLSISPTVGVTPAPATLTLTSPASSGPCVDTTGAGATSAVLEEFEVAFPSLSCFVGAGAQGVGDATIEWSNGTSSELDVVATMSSALQGTVRFEVTSGAYDGMAGSTWFGISPTQGSCFDTGVSGATAYLDRLDLA